jgi:hypothetical protein
MVTPNHSSTKGLQLALNSVAVGDVESLGFFERGKRLFGLRGVTAVAVQLRQNFALPGDMLLAKRNVIFGQREMLFEHFPVHSDLLAQVFRLQP